MRDNYVREFNAVVQHVGDGYVVLDRTAFYPEGGGQSGVRGTLTSGESTVHILGTFKEKGEVQHRYDDDVVFQVGDAVCGALDWPWRYECMRFHTGQHILSKYLQINYGLETVGNNITPGRSRADYSLLEQFDEQMKRDVESGVNEMISRNMDVEVPKSVKEFRVVKIGDYDASSCAGTHIANTSEIGLIQIGKTKNVGAGKRRIYFSLTDE